MTSLTNEQVFAELYYSKKAIKDVMGMTVQCWRPPYGDVDDRVRYIAQALGMRTIIWSDNTFDYQVSTLGAAAVEANYQTVINGGKNGTYNSNGTIVLTHELNNDTMSIMVQNYASIKAAFSHVAPIHVALNSTMPYVETGYTYPVRSACILLSHTRWLQTADLDPSVYRTLHSGPPARLRSPSPARLPHRATSPSRSRFRPARPARSRLRLRTRRPVAHKPRQLRRPRRPRRTRGPARTA